MKKMAISIITSLLLISGVAQAEPIKRKICVFDIAGNVGPIMQAMRDWRAVAIGWGLDAELIPFTNEAIAAEELRSNRCDASMMTGIRGRLFNQYAGTLDSIGSIPDNKHLRVVLRVLAHPTQAEKMTQGAYTIMGIAPASAAYVFVNNKEVNTLAKAAGKRVAVLEYDPTQAQMVAQVGATPVASDLTNFSNRFNNGVVDIIAAPLAAYGALELYRGLSPNGGIIDYPLAQISVQLIARTDRFPADMMQASREYFLESFDHIFEVLDREAEAVDPNWFIKIPEKDKQEYEVMMQEARVQLRDDGYYHPDMLRLQREIRCRFDSARPECTNPVE